MSTCTICIKDFEPSQEATALGHDVCLAREELPRIREEIKRLDFEIAKHVEQTDEEFSKTTRAEERIKELEAEIQDILNPLPIDKINKAMHLMAGIIE